ncbi:MAG TPA: outer membrane lipoprotein chaperone LolA [Gammaproteobacteria bacterium]|nr:outer membrane lipoprotein chaperone LolA [Gammaproteobacteria bacterium]
MSTAAVAAASAQQPGESVDDATGLAALEAFLADVKSLAAEFEQEIWTADHRLLQTETGTLALERPNRFRWTYREPTELTVVADGTKLWIYDVELEQVTVAPLDDTLLTSPAMLLSGDRSVREGFTVTQSYELEGLDWIKLTPKAGGTDFMSVRIGFDGTAPKRLELVDGLNQVTRITLDNLVVNPEIDDATFELEVPDGVDVSGEG